MSSLEQGAGRDCFARHPDNPILTTDDLPVLANAVFNPGATLVDGETLLLLRVEDRRGLSALHVARSHDGVHGWRVDREPLLAPEPGKTASEWGYEDARVVRCEELESWVITCTAFGPGGPCVYLATTTDFESLDRAGVAVPPEDKNAAVFPRRLGGQWCLLHRPVVAASGSFDIWMSRSDDLTSWRSPDRLMTCRPGGWWDHARIGIGPPPIETAEGWLLLYHGVRMTVAGGLYRVGAVLLDLEDPLQVRARTDDWLMSPVAPYERIGDVPNVVFPCGAVVDGDVLRVYYGAADTSVALATASISELLEVLL
jgi:predicted GH43/DUF377 family glycosyl hydrolase